MTRCVVQDRRACFRVILESSHTVPTWMNTQPDSHSLALSLSLNPRYANANIAKHESNTD